MGDWYQNQPRFWFQEGHLKYRRDWGGRGFESFVFARENRHWCTDGPLRLDEHDRDVVRRRRPVAGLHGRPELRHLFRPEDRGRDPDPLELVREVRRADTDRVVRVGCENDILAGIVPKGSVGIDGISLTVAETAEALQRIGIGISRLGTSEAVAIGAYAFALHQLDAD